MLTSFLTTPPSDVALPPMTRRPPASTAAADPEVGGLANVFQAD